MEQNMEPKNVYKVNKFDKGTRTYNKARIMCSKNVAEKN
jgi:hypothetical protein